MLYVVTALKSEAQAFVEKYKLSKTKYDNFTLFEGENIKVIVSGIGVNNAKNATNTMIRYFKPESCDVFLNIGICGANKNYKIGELIPIGSVIYENRENILNPNILNSIACKDTEVHQYGHNIVDMESFGFYEATKEIKNRYIYKVVSDYFEPEKVTKEKTKALIFKILEEVMQKVKV